MYLIFPDINRFCIDVYLSFINSLFSLIQQISITHNLTGQKEVMNMNIDIYEYICLFKSI